jgi:hypothetical protein
MADIINAMTVYAKPEFPKDRKPSRAIIHRKKGFFDKYKARHTCERAV